MGGEAEETNLAFGAEPITLKDFVDRKYLPFSAKPRLKNPVSYTGEFNLAKALCKRPRKPVPSGRDPREGCRSLQRAVVEGGARQQHH